jgi:hypothetical protein
MKNNIKLTMINPWKKKQLSKYETRFHNMKPRRKQKTFTLTESSVRPVAPLSLRLRATVEDKPTVT